jgi:hypothetical protein
MTAKADSLDKLLARMNTRQLLPNHEEQFIKAGSLAYEYLIEKLDSTHLTDYQVINALHILVTMRYIGEPSEVIEKILDLTQDKRIRVRSVASRIAIVLLLQSEHCGTPAHQLNRKDLGELMNNALLIGLDCSSISFALDFINGKIYRQS